MAEVPNRVHLVGVGGAGMSGLAKLLAQQGRLVSGSDLRPSPAFAELAELGVDVWVGHRPEMVAHVDLVVASSAVPPGDAELAAARDADVPIWSRPKLLEAITHEMPAIGFAGTHGKTTSTALAVAAVRAAGRDPSFLVGGRILDVGSGAHLGEPELFILEADEAFGTFQALHLRGLLVTNIEVDHLDHYETFDNLVAAFRDVVERTRGPVVVCHDDQGAMLVATSETITYGRSPGSDWRIENVASNAEGVVFELTGPESSHRVRVPKPGDHMALNAAGVIALLAALGIDPEKSVAGIGAFSGLRRRFESRGSLRGVRIVDDYAHHPTEVAATIEAARAVSTGRVVAAFQPHRYTRTSEHYAEFGAALARADVAVVTDVYAAGEKPVPGITGELIAKAVGLSGGTAHYVPHRSDLAAGIEELLAEGDLLLTLGAGDITGLATELIQRAGSA